MPNPQKANLLRGKDLIAIGIFSAIYFVLNFICMLISGLPLSKLHSARCPADRGSLSSFPTTMSLCILTGNRPAATIMVTERSQLMKG